MYNDDEEEIDLEFLEDQTWDTLTEENEYKEFLHDYEDDHILWLKNHNDRLPFNPNQNKVVTK